MDTLEMQRLLAEKHGADNPLFKDEIYLMAMQAAFLSPCQKMGFGVPIELGGEIIAVTHNMPLEATAHICDPRCVRFDIASRTESMLGACNHAEEWALDEMRRRKLDPADCKIYVAGIMKDGTPWIKDEPTFSCIRCANQLYRARIGGLFMPVVDRWVETSYEKLLEQALPYATGKKTA